MSRQYDSMSRYFRITMTIACLVLAATAAAQSEILSVFGHAESASDNPQFGAAAASGDFDGDMIRDLVVGAPGLGLPGTNFPGEHGAVYVLHGPFAANQLPNVTTLFDDLVGNSFMGKSVAFADRYRFQSPGTSLPVFVAGVPGTASWTARGFYKSGESTQSFVLASTTVRHSATLPPFVISMAILTATLQFELAVLARAPAAQARYIFFLAGRPHTPPLTSLSVRKYPQTASGLSWVVLPT